MLCFNICIVIHNGCSKLLISEKKEGREKDLSKFSFLNTQIVRFPKVLAEINIVATAYRIFTIKINLSPSSRTRRHKSVNPIDIKIIPNLFVCFIVLEAGLQM